MLFCNELSPPSDRFLGRSDGLFVYGIPLCLHYDSFDLYDWIIVSRPEMAWHKSWSSFNHKNQGSGKRLVRSGRTEKAVWPLGLNTIILSLSYPFTLLKSIRLLMLFCNELSPPSDRFFGRSDGLFVYSIPFGCTMILLIYMIESLYLVLKWLDINHGHPLIIKIKVQTKD